MAITLISIYVLSTIGAYFEHRKNYSKGGIWSSLYPGMKDIIITFTPVINTIFLMMNFFLTDSIVDLSKFFNVKK